MAKNRVAIPLKIREQVLKEFNYSCALCGTKNPQVHHLDENPENNDVNNLLPLCPNCHLIDQHNPTAQIDSEKLRLFRQYKDPGIIDTRFEPLFRRIRFLDDVKDDSNVKELQSKVSELITFVEALQMGNFYGKQFNEILKMPGHWYSGQIGPDPERDRQVRLNDQKYREQLRNARIQIYALAVELLRYQNWAQDKTR